MPRLALILTEVCSAIIDGVAVGGFVAMLLLLFAIISNH